MRLKQTRTHLIPNLTDKPVSLIIVSMGPKKFVATFIMPFICVGFLSSQSVVEAAKKEKERRAKIKKKSTKVVTNADLKKRKKSPSVSETTAQVIEAEQEKPESKTSPKKKEEVPQPEKETGKDESANITLLEQKYEQAKARVERLLEKMNALWQKYNNPGDMTPKDRVQSEIARTYLMLQKAQKEAVQAEKEWETALSRKDK
jgi:hypothetical protein